MLYILGKVYNQLKFIAINFDCVIIPIYSRFWRFCMKKITKLVAVMAVLSSVLMMCGCGLKDAIDATHNKWYKYNNENGIDIPLGDDSSTSSAQTQTLQGAELYLYFDDSEGLVAIVQKETEAEVTVLGIPQTMTVITGAKKQYTKEQFGSVKWGTLVASGKISECNEPEMSANPDKCYDVSEIFTQGVQWKKVLANILIKQLLEE